MRPAPRAADDVQILDADALALAGDLVVDEGDGPVDSAFRCVQSIVAHEAELEVFTINAITEGIDAQATVTVRLAEGGKTVVGQAADTDIVVASIRAYVAALNKLLVKRERTAPAALSA